MGNDRLHVIVADGGPIVGGLVLLGDSALYTNPTPPDPIERLRLAIFNASRTDAQVALPLRRMIHFVPLPQDVIGNGAVRAALNALLAARPELTARAAGPRREEIAAACASP
jgi:hypothetical protein